MIAAYHVTELFQQLDDADDISTDEIARLEISLLSLLDDDSRPEGKRQLAAQLLIGRTPKLFAECVSTMIHLRKEGMYLTVAHHLLETLTLPELTQDDDQHENLDLLNYISEALVACDSMGVREEGTEVLGRAVGRVPDDANGNWPPDAVSQVIESIPDELVPDRKFIEGIVLGRLNSRGVTSRGVFDGGEQERNIEMEYRMRADVMQIEAPRTARILRMLAEDYAHSAKYEDERAAWDDLTYR